MQDELRRGARNSFAMWHVIERPLQLRMLRNVLADLRHGLAGGLQALFEFALGFHLGFAERHLHAAVGVDFTFTRGLDRQEDHVFEFVNYGGLYAVRLR